MKLWKRLVWTGFMLVLLFTIRTAHLAAQDAERYRQGFIPVAVALVEDFRYPDADAVILRRTQGPPHDVILLRASVASGELLANAVAMLQMVHVQKGACPSENMVVRVRDLEGRRTPEWSARDSKEAESTIQGLRGRVLQRLPEIGQVRLKRVWIRRYYGSHEPFPGPGGPRTSVC